MSLFTKRPAHEKKQTEALSATLAGPRRWFVFLFMLLIILSLYSSSSEAAAPRIPEKIRKMIGRDLVGCFTKNPKCNVLLMLEPARQYPSPDVRQLVNHLQSHAENSQVDVKNYLRKQNVEFSQTWIQHAVSFDAPWSLVLYLFQHFTGILFAHLNSHKTTYCSMPFETIGMAQAQSKLFNVSPSLLESLASHGDPPVVAFFDSGWDTSNTLLAQKYAGTDPDTGAMDHNYAWFSPNMDQPTDTLGHGSNTIALALASQSGISERKTRFIAASCERGIHPSPLTSTQLRSCHLEALQWFLSPTDKDGKNPDPSRGPKLILTGFPVHQLGRDFSAAYEILGAAGKIVIAPLGHREEGPASKQPSTEELEIDLAFGGTQAEVVDYSMPSSVITVASVGQDGSYSNFNDVIPKADVAYLGENLRAKLSDMLLQGTSYSAAMLMGLATIIVSCLPYLHASQLKAMLQKNSVSISPAMGPGVVNMTALLEFISLEVSKKDLCELDKNMGILTPLHSGLPFRDGADQEAQLESRKQHERMLTEEESIVTRMVQQGNDAASLPSVPESKTPLSTSRSAMITLAESLIAFVISAAVILILLCCFR